MQRYGSVTELIHDPRVHDDEIESRKIVRVSGRKRQPMARGNGGDLRIDRRARASGACGLRDEHAPSPGNVGIEREDASLELRHHYIGQPFLKCASPRATKDDLVASGARAKSTLSIECEELRIC